MPFEAVWCAQIRYKNFERNTYGQASAVRAIILLCRSNALQLKAYACREKKSQAERRQLKETTTSAVEREKAGKMFELNEKYKDFPERVSEYEIDGKKYIVHSRFVGEKNIDEVIGRLAFERAVKETLA